MLNPASCLHDPELLEFRNQFVCCRDCVGGHVITQIDGGHDATSPNRSGWPNSDTGMMV